MVLHYTNLTHFKICLLGYSEVVVKALIKGDFELALYSLLLNDVVSFSSSYFKLLYSHTKKLHIDWLD